MSRRRLIGLGLSAALLLAAGGGLSALLGSTTGLHWALDTLVARSAGRLAHGGAEGTLAGEVRLQDVRLAIGASTTVHIVEARIVGRPWLLVLGKLQFESLSLRGVTVEVRPVADAPPLVIPARLNLPVHVSVEALEVEYLRVLVEGLPPLEFDTLRARLAADARGHRIEALDAQGPETMLRGALSMLPTRPYALDGRFDLDWRPTDHPPLAARLQVSGELEAMRLTAEVQAPAVLAMQATLHAPFGRRLIDARLTSQSLGLRDLDARLPGLVLAGSTRVQGELRRPLALELDGALDISAPAQPVVHTRFAARLDAQALQVEHLEARVAGGFSGRATLRGRLGLADHTIDGALLWQDLATARSGPVSSQGRLDISGTRERVTWSGRAAPPGSSEETVDLQGWFQPGDHGWQADLAWSRVDPPANLAVPMRLGAGRLGLRGQATAADFVLDSEVRPDAAPGGRVAARGRVDRAGLRTAELALDWLGGRARGQARLDWAEVATPSLHLELEGRDFDPGQHWTDWPGRVGGRMRLDAGRDAEGAHARLTVHDLAGRLRGAALAGDARIAWRPGAFSVPELSVTLGASRLRASHDSESGSRWDIAIPDLSVLLDEAQGSLNSRGVWRGDWRAPELELQLDGRDLVWRAYRLGRVGAHTSGAGADRRLMIEARTLAHDDLALDSLDLDLRGTPAAHQAELALGSSTGRLSATLTGGATADGWRGRLATARLGLRELGDWALVAPVELSSEPGASLLPSACWRNAEAEACIEASLRDQAWRAEATLTRLSLASLAPLLPGGLEYAGVFDGRVWLRGGDAPLAALAELRLSEGQVSQRRSDGVRELLGFRAGTTRVALADSALETRVALDLGDDATLELDLATRTDGDAAARPLRGRLAVHMDDFALIPVLVPELREFAGRLDADLAIGGTRGAPRLTGEARFDRGVASIPRLGLALSEVQFTLRGEGDALRIEGSAAAGGPLRWQGALSRKEDGWHGRLEVDGERFRVLDLPEAQLTVTPRLSVSLAGRALSVDGVLRVPSARLAPRDLAGTVAVSSDQVLVQAGDPDLAATGWRVSARVRTVLGDDVHFDGFGLRARVVGEILATDTPDQLTLASGELAVVDGQYEAYGQQLTVERGRLLFTGGPLADPGMDVRATRRIEGLEDGEEDITVGVNIRGTLRRPQTTLFADSREPLDESQQLSLLVLGHRLEQGSGAESGALEAARGQLGLMTGGAYLARTLGRQVGLEDVSIRQVRGSEAGTTNAQLVLGKYLSPRLYLSYGIGLFEPLNTVRLRYRLSSKWSVEAESGEENAADFKYTIEK